MKATLSAICLGLAACGTVPAPAAPGTLEALTATIGDPVCTSDAQCRTAPVGWRACGGPQSYLAWSTARSDAAAVGTAAARYAAAQRDANRASGRVSTCMFVSDPGASCTPAASGSRCTLRGDPPR